MVRVKTNRNRTAEELPAATGTERVLRLLFGRGKVVALLLVVLGLGWGMHTMWQHYAPRVGQRSHYLLTNQRISISAPPEWINKDVRSEVVRNAGLVGRLSVLDEAFAQVIEDAFALHPWVESVDRITKLYPAGVHVDLTYRRPVAVVELVSHNIVQLLPVDRTGVHLPATDVPSIRKRYLPRIGGIIERPPIGQAWSDQRVFGAVELAEQLASVWESLHLVDILPSARPEVRAGERYFVFNLITRGGTRVIWGAAPSASPPGEDKLATKLERLKSSAQRYGPLDSVRGPAEIHVRGELAIRPRTVKRPKVRDKESPVVK